MKLFSISIFNHQIINNVIPTIKVGVVQGLAGWTKGFIVLPAKGDQGPFIGSHPCPHPHRHYVLLRCEHDQCEKEAR